MRAEPRRPTVLAVYAAAGVVVAAGLAIVLHAVGHRVGHRTVAAGGEVAIPLLLFSAVVSGILGRNPAVRSANTCGWQRRAAVRRDLRARRAPACGDVGLARALTDAAVLVWWPPAWLAVVCCVVSANAAASGVGARWFNVVLAVAGVAVAAVQLVLRHRLITGARAVLAPW